MSDINRRTFLVTSSILAAGASAAHTDEPIPTTTATTSTPPRPPQVALGRTNLNMSRLAIGTGVHGGNRQSDQSRMGFERLVALFRHAHNRGITFFDLADLYGTHLYFREALRTMQRDRISIMTKLWWRYDGSAEPIAEPHQRRNAVATLERFRHELNTDYLDIVLLHCVTEADWDVRLRPYMDALDEAKQRRQVKAVGVSCHSLVALNRAAECPWVDVILARINPHRSHMDGTVEEITAVLRRARENGKAIIGMKIFGEGDLVQHKEECIRFAQTNGLLDTMTIGFMEPAQIDEVLTLLSRTPATALVAPRATATP